MTEATSKEKPEKVKKKLALPKLRYVFVFFVVLVAIGVASYLLLRDTRQVVDCNMLYSQADQEYKEKKYQEVVNSYNLMKDICIEPVSGLDKDYKITSRIEPFQAYVLTGNTAMSYNWLKNKEKAKEFAEQAIEKSKALTSEQRGKIPNQNVQIVNYYFIQKDQEIIQ